LKIILELDSFLDEEALKKLDRALTLLKQKERKR